MVFTFNIYKKKLVNRINNFGIIKKLDIYMQLMNKFLILWKDDGFIYIPSKKQMKIPLKEG